MCVCKFLKREYMQFEAFVPQQVANNLLYEKVIKNSKANEKYTENFNDFYDKKGKKGFFQEKTKAGCKIFGFWEDVIL